jgi:undecaprenyl-diphosphatase
VAEPAGRSDVRLVTRLRSFVAARFARGEYLGLHLTVGFLISASALWLFGSITEDVVNNEALTAVDLSFHAWMRVHATPLGDQTALVISFLGGPMMMTIIALVVGMILARRGAWLMLSAWLAAFVVGAFLDWMLKNMIRRPRPVGAERFLHGISFSYPSGHSMGSLIGFAMLSYVLFELWPPAHRHRAIVVIATVALVLLVGWSRLYLGVHYLSDVIAGFAAGAVWVTACITGLELATRPRDRGAHESGLSRERRL